MPSVSGWPIRLPGNRFPGENTCDPVEPGAGQQYAVGESGEPRTGDPQCIGVSDPARSVAGRAARRGIVRRAPAPSVASTSTAPAPVGDPPGERGLQQIDAAAEQDRDVSVVRGPPRGPSHGKPPKIGAPAPRSLPERADLALGKYARPASGRGPQCTVSRRDQIMSRRVSSLAAEKFSSCVCWYTCHACRRPRSRGSRPSRSRRSPSKGWRSDGGRPTT
mgnify:CR=1 FL=1